MVSGQLATGQSASFLNYQWCHQHKGHGEKLLTLLRFDNFSAAFLEVESRSTSSSSNIDGVPKM